MSSFEARKVSGLFSQSCHAGEFRTASGHAAHFRPAGNFMAAGFFMAHAQWSLHRGHEPFGQLR